MKTTTIVMLLVAALIDLTVSQLTVTVTRDVTTVYLSDSVPRSTWKEGPSMRPTSTFSTHDHVQPATEPTLPPYTAVEPSVKTSATISTSKQDSSPTSIVHHTWSEVSWSGRPKNRSTTVTNSALETKSSIIIASPIDTKSSMIDTRSSMISLPAENPYSLVSVTARGIPTTLAVVERTCKKDGARCDLAKECCGGICNQETMECVTNDQAPAVCRAKNDKCKLSIDCCSKMCRNGKCVVSQTGEEIE